MSIEIEEHIKGVVIKPIISSKFNAQCRVNLIGFLSYSHRKMYKLVLVYQVHLAKFIILKLLKYKRAEEVAFYPIDIFIVYTNG